MAKQIQSKVEDQVAEVATDAEVTARPVEQWYIALQRIGGDGEVWLPGSLIALNDERALILMEKGVVAPAAGTIPPPPPPPAIIVHEPVAGNGGL